MRSRRFILCFCLVICLAAVPFHGFAAQACGMAFPPVNEMLGSPAESTGSSHASSSRGVQTSSVVPFLAQVSVATARLRAWAGVRAGLIEELSFGEEVTVLGQTTGSDGKVWYRVQYGQWYGYIRFDQLEALCGTARLGGPAEPTGLCIGQTNTRAVNVRLGMSTSSARVRLLRRGQTVTLLGLCRDYMGVPWYYVRIPSGAIGYIRGEFITVISGTVAESVPSVSPAVPAGVPAAPGPEAAASVDEELLYLRWISAHMADINQIGEGYQGYSLYDLDGDGIREILVNCSGPLFSLWQIYSCDGDEIIDLGQLAANGYYLAGKGSGMLLISVLSDSQTQYHYMKKVGDSLVTMYSLMRTADAAWQYTWTYTQKPVSVDSLRLLLSDFTDDVLQNMGLYRGTDEISFPAGAEING